MSGEDGERTPDLTDAVLGFRVWMLHANGGLGAMVTGTRWERGPNEAVCAPNLIPSRRPQHEAPHPGCLCGFNAYFTLSPKLRVSHMSAVGAIAAWGEMDIYADGFRAQYAQVIALALPTDGGSGTIDRLRRAADVYDVPLVPAHELRAEALRHASPLAPSMLPEREPAKPKPPRRRAPRKSAAPQPGPPPGRQLRPVVSVASWKRARGHSLWVRRHVSVSATEDELRLGPAPGASAIADPQGAVRVRPIHSRVEAGECVATIAAAYPGRLLHLRTPVGGRVSGHNIAFLDALRDGDRAVSAAPWLLQLEPDDSPLEDAPLLWGRPGVELYRRNVVRQSDADVLAEMGPPAGFDPGALDPLTIAVPAAPPALAPHQRATGSLTPERGKRAAIMVEHLRPLLQACGEDGTLLAA